MSVEIKIRKGETVDKALRRLKKKIDRDVTKSDTHAQAKHSCDKVLPAMLKVRAAADALEEIVADEYWPLPSYQELLFLR